MRDRRTDLRLLRTAWPLLAAALPALLLAGRPADAKLPAPDHVLFGTALRQGELVTQGLVEVKLGEATDALITYRLGTTPTYGERFVLRLPMDTVDPQRAGTARTGDEARIYLDGELAGCVAVGDPGVAQEVDIDTSFDENPEVWIVDQDASTPPPPPDATVVEGGEGTQQQIYLEVRLSRAVRYDVQVDWATANGSAIGGAASPADFLTASGTVTIPEGEVQAFIPVTVFGDAVAEADETFGVTLSNPRRHTLSTACQGASGVALRDGWASAVVTILGDDSRQAVRVADTRVLEGDGGVDVHARFLVTADLEVPNVQGPHTAGPTITVDYSTADGTATAGSDYLATSGSAVIDLGTVCPDVGLPCAVVEVPILPDNVEEPDETFTLTLARPAGETGYDLLDATATGTIASDEHFLYYVETERQGTTCAACLGGPLGGAVSPDGANVYVAAGLDDTLDAFARDLTSGALTLLESEVDGVGGADGLGGVQAVAVSPDGAHVYAAGFHEDQIGIFSRNPDGTLVPAGLANRGTALLDGPVSLALSPDGAFLYAAAKLGNEIEVYQRDAGTGALTYVSRVVDGPSIDGLLGPRAVVVSPDGAHVYAASAIDSAVTMFARNAASGALSYLGLLRDATGNPAIDGLNGATALAFSPDGKDLYVAGELDDSIAVLQRDPATGLLTWLHRRRNGLSGVDGLAHVAGVAVSADGGYVFGASRDGNAISVFRRDTTVGSPTFGRLVDFVEARFDGDPDPNGTDDGGGPQIDGLAGGVAVLVSPEPDGRHVYVVGNVDDGVAVFHKDQLPPLAPTFAVPTPSGHTPGVWSNDPAIVVGWTSSENAYGVGIAGYPRLFDEAPATDPGTTLTQLHDAGASPQTAATTLADGVSHFVHVRACDRADNCSGAAHQGPFLIDTVKPVGPGTLSSPSHQPNVVKSLADLALAWSAASDAASGLAGYELLLDHTQGSSCTGVQNLGPASVDATVTLADGSWWAHLCAVDVAGNWSDPIEAGPYLIDTTPPHVVATASVTAAAGGLAEGHRYPTGPSQLLLTFDGPVVDPVAPASYAVVAGGVDGVVETSACGPPPGDDVAVGTGVGGFDPLGPTVSLDPAGATLAAGAYRVLACSGTSLSDAAGNALDGDGNGSAGGDFALGFSVRATNLLANPNFDADLASWTLSSLGAFTRDAAADADDLVAFSGAAKSGSVAGTKTLSQCVAVGPQALRLRYRARIASDRADSPTVQGKVRFFNTAGCGADTTGTPLGDPVVGDTGGDFAATDSPSLAPPPGSASARVLIEIVPGASTSTVWLDSVSFDDDVAIFQDTFESGSVLWSSQQP